MTACTKVDDLFGSRRARRIAARRARWARGAARDLLLRDAATLAADHLRRACDRPPRTCALSPGDVTAGCSVDSPQALVRTALLQVALDTWRGAVACRGAAPQPQAPEPVAEDPLTATRLWRLITRLWDEPPDAVFGRSIRDLACVLHAADLVVRGAAGRDDAIGHAAGVAGVDLSGRHGDGAPRVRLGDDLGHVLALVGAAGCR